VLAGGYAVVRLTIEPLRVTEPGWTPGWFDPMLYLIVAVVAAVWLAAPRLQERTRFALRRPSPAA
jgi:hypothetical protein